MTIYGNRPAVQKGSTLIVALILLVILTVLAVSEVSFNTILTRVAANSSDALVAFNTAEGALSQATTRLLAGTYSTSNFVSNSNGLYLLAPGNAPLWTTVNWSSSATAMQSYQGNSSATAAYIIEQLPSVTLPGQSMAKPTSIYRITARAVGSSGSSPVILQTIIQIPQL